jgi:hypothetical protein
MPYLVQLHIFSGRPDPVWPISDQQAAELFEEQRLRPDQLFEERDAAATAEAQVASGLGYRGFSLLETTREFRQGVALEKRPAKVVREAYLRDSPDIERRLLDSGGRMIDPTVAKAAREAMAAPTHAAGSERPCPKCHALLAPAYNPGFWNNNPARRANNNCYNYANNKVTNTFAQPGRGTGQMYSALTCASVRPASVRDGLKVKPNFSGTLLLGWYVALVIWPGVDFHWYRQDKNGCWSHKPGSTAARNTDNSGNTITDPQTCDRGPYTVFCCYMKTHKGVQIN